MTFDQMVVAAKHTLCFTASRRMKRVEDTDKNIPALHAPTRCSFNIAHR
jgi:hypothetical protein